MKPHWKLTGVACKKCKKPLVPYWRKYLQPNPPTVLVLTCDDCGIGFSAELDAGKVDVFGYIER